MSFVTQAASGLIAGFNAAANPQLAAPVDPYADLDTGGTYVGPPGAPVGVPANYKAFAGVTYDGYLGQTPNIEYRKPKYDYNDLAAAGQQDPNAILAMQMRLYNLGALDSIDYPGMFDEGTHDALEQVYTVANTRGWSIDQLEKYMMENRKAFKEMGITEGGYSSSYGSSGGSGADYSPYTTTSTSSSTATSTSTSEQVDLIGRGTARAILEAAWESEVGREANGKEFRKFLSYIRGKQRENPSTSRTKSTTTTDSTTTTTTDPSPSGDTSVSSNTDSDTNTKSRTVSKESNVNPTQEAEDFAEKHGGKERQAFQSGQYFSALASLIDGA